MTEINIPPREQQALDELDTKQLHTLIDEAVNTQSMGELRALSLWSCGPHIARFARHFEEALTAYGTAKSGKKLTEARVRALRAGTDLLYAVREIKDLLETQRREEQLFKINDYVLPPSRYHPQLAVRIGYQWRDDVELDWQFGSIIFEHEVDVRPPIGLAPPKRKRSAAQQEDELEDKLYQAWDGLKTLCLLSLQEFFRTGGDGAAIPDRFVAKVDRHTRGLNNYSTDFWRERG